MVAAVLGIKALPPVSTVSGSMVWRYGTPVPWYFVRLTQDGQRLFPLYTGRGTLMSAWAEVWYNPLDKELRHDGNIISATRRGNAVTIIHPIEGKPRVWDWDKA